MIAIDLNYNGFTIWTMDLPENTIFNPESRRNIGDFEFNTVNIIYPTDDDCGCDELYSYFVEEFGATLFCCFKTFQDYENLKLDLLAPNENCIPRIYIFHNLGSSCHMKLTEKVVDLFRVKDTNPHGHILIATTYDVRLMHQSVTNADQIWLIAKDKPFISIADYVDYDPIGLQHQYMEGDFGYLPDWF